MKNLTKLVTLMGLLFLSAENAYCRITNVQLIRTIECFVKVFSMSLNKRYCKESWEFLRDPP